MAQRHQIPLDFAGVTWPAASRPTSVPASNSSSSSEAMALFSTSPMDITTSNAPRRRSPDSDATSRRAFVQPSTSAPAATRFIPPPAASNGFSASSSSVSLRPANGNATSTDAIAAAPRSSPLSQPRPTHERKKSVPWIPDSLAERCYGCHASFSLVLRRHHCRRCGNVFCDTCSSARIPLASAGFFTPVRVCEKCCVAAKRAHAKLVEEKKQQQQQLEPYLLFPQAPTARESLTGRSSSSSSVNRDAHHHLYHHAAQRRSSLPPQRRKHNRPHADAVPHASGMFFQPSLSSSAHHHHPSRTRHGSSGDSAEELARRLSAQYATAQHDANDGGDDEEDDDDRNRLRMQLLPGEVGLECSENVRIRILERLEHVGTLHITNYRIVFSPYVGSSGRNSADASCRSTTVATSPMTAALVKEDELPYASDVHSDAVHAYQAIPLVSVERLKKREMVESDSGLLDIVCKDFRHVQFVFTGLVARQTFSRFDRTHSLIRQHAFSEPAGLSTTGLPCAFATASTESFATAPLNGWRVYNPVAEFQRMGVSSSSRWRISQSNGTYSVCPTYPSLVAVPATVSDSVLAVAAKFRSKGRIPVLSWRDIRSGATICRSSQPLVGLSQKQCDKDVFLIQAIAAANPSSSKLVIVDARPWKNAVAQKTVGRAGYELTDHYETRHATASLKYADMVAAAAAAIETSTVASSPVNGADASSSSVFSGDDDDASSSGDRTQLLEAIESSLVLTECKLVFMGIENIHAMRKSYTKLLDACVGKQSNDKWLDHLDGTHWLEHASRILESAVEIVRLVKEQRASVLIHCSDGWDRTAQLTSLAQLMLDPYYRTIQGFEVLIEKEWCSFGHKFRDRTGHGISNASSEISPVFLQWIDCVWQLVTQFPSSFEFNERFLIVILDHLYACRFGTFLYNSQQQRNEYEATRPTVSLWTYVSTLDRTVITNPFYHSHDAPRKQWQASVTATRQVFELPAAAVEVTGAHRDGLAVALARRGNGHTPSRLTGDSLVHTDDSSLSSNGYESDTSEARRAHVDRADLDEFIHDIQTELADVGAAAGSLPAVRGAGAIAANRGDFASESGSESDDEDDGNNDAARHHPRASVFHKIVRDLDAGFSFPQPIDVSTMTTLPPLSSTSAVSLDAIRAPPRRSRSSSSSTGAAAAMPDVASATPPTRPSLSTLFTPMGGDRMSDVCDAMWNASEVDAASETDEPSSSRIGTMGSFDAVIIPCCAIKALHFWTRYYLRWDPAANFGRDASVEVETLYRDLLLRFDALQLHVDTVRHDEATKWRRKLQRRHMRRRRSSLGGRGSTASRRMPASSFDEADDEEDDANGGVFAFDDAPSFSRSVSSSRHDVIRPSHVDVVDLSSPIDHLLKDANRHGMQSESMSTRAVDEVLAQLEQERQASLALVEQTYRDSVARLLRQQS